MGRQADSFHEYVGRDDRIARFEATCARYGLQTIYHTGRSMCSIDAISPYSHRPISVDPYPHTLTIDLDSDLVTILSRDDADDGIDALVKCCEGWNLQDNSPEGFIDSMRSVD